MTKYPLSDDRSFNNTLADYADSLTDHNRKPVLVDKSDVEMTGLIKTINDFHSLAISIKADEELKRTILRNIHADWERKQQVKDHPKPFWIQTVKSIFERPVLQHASALAAVTLFILGIVLCLQPGSQNILGTAENLKTGLTIVLFVLAALALIWMFIKDKK